MVECFDEVTLVGPVKDHQVETGLRFSGYSSEGNEVASIRHRRGNAFNSPLPQSLPTSEFQGAAIYGGVLFPHFGHFLLESLSRIWAAIEYTDMPIVWFNLDDHQRLLSWQSEIFDLLAIENKRHVFITGPTKIDKLIVPDQGFNLWVWYDRRLARYVSIYPFKPPDLNKKVWLSRSDLPTHLGGVENENELERILESKGWTIAHPETLTVKQQLEMLSDASEIAGISGSAFHLLILGKNVKARVSLVNRPMGDTGSQRMIAFVNGFRQRVIEPEFTAVIGKHSYRRATFSSIESVASAVMADFDDS